MRLCGALMMISVLTAACLGEEPTKVSQKYRDADSEHSVIELNDENFDSLVKDG